MGVKKLAVWVSRAYSKDALFDPSSPLNRDNCLSSAHLLRACLEERGWECHTQDVYQAADTAPDAVLFNDIPAGGVDAALGSWASGARRFAALLECDVIKPENWRPGAHDGFEAVFTWDERCVDGVKYFKANFSNHFPGDVEPDAGPRPGFCVMITANKKSRHPLELYSERTRTVRWFEANHPERFDLYGIGWNRYLFEGPAPVRLLNRVGPLTRLLAEKYPSYRGTVDEKLPVLRKYKYSVCYENARDIPGYITEKIFDSMFAGCVPVYWGAPDISRHVPEDCFIDRRKFSSHEALYKYLDGLPGPAYAKMREAMRAYVKSAGAGPFSDAYYARTVCGRISE